MKTIWAFVLSALAIGFLAGRLTAPDASEQELPAEPAGSPDSEVESPDVATPVPASAELPSTDPASARELFFEAIETASFEAPVADGEIVITAIDDLDRPIPDLAVELHFISLRSREWIDDEDDLQGYLWQRVERSQLKERLTQELQTDAAGSAVFSVPSDAVYQLQVRGPGYQLDYKHREISAGDEILVRGHLAAAVEVTARFPDGSVAPSARVSLQRVGSRVGGTITADHPFITASPGRYDVTASLDGRWESSPVEVILEKGVIIPVEVTFEARYQVGGAIRWPEEEKPSIASVWLVSRAEHPDPAVIEELPRGSRKFTNHTSYDRYHFGQVTPGAYWLLAKRTDTFGQFAAGMGLSFEAIDVVDSDLERQLNLEPIDPREVIHATLRMSDGSIPRSIEWQLLGVLPDSSQRRVEVARVNLMSGAQLLFPLQKDSFHRDTDLDSFESFQLVGRSGSMSARAEGSLSIGDHAEVVLPPAASVQVSILGTDFADLSLEARHEQTGHGIWVNLDEEGRAEISQISAGNVIFTLRRSVEDRSKRFEHVETITLSPGANSIQLTGP